MMPKDADPLKYAWDALDAALRIGRFVSGKASDDYMADEMLRSAVERQFEIMGEALGALRKVAPEEAAKIKDLPRIVAFRNVLIHGYDSINDLLVWEVATQDLGAAVIALRRLLGST
jgi:uncharacterized protein with HEPN domain